MLLIYKKYIYLELYTFQLIDKTGWSHNDCSHWILLAVEKVLHVTTNYTTLLIVRPEVLSAGKP